MNKFLVLAAVMLAFTVTAFGQATANVGARILGPISIAKDVDLHFGTIIKGTNASTILLTPGNVRSVATGNAALSGANPVNVAASFTVTGDPSATYSVTLPADGTVTITGPVPAMGVNSFTSNPSGLGLVLDGTTGTQTLTVGATLSVAANQTSGTYSGTFQVSVNYN